MGVQTCEQGQASDLLKPLYVEPFCRLTLTRATNPDGLTGTCGAILSAYQRVWPRCFVNTNVDFRGYVTFLIDNIFQRPDTLLKNVFQPWRGTPL